MKKLKGNITISKVHGPDGYYVELRVRDKLSLNTFIEVKMSLEDYARVITGLAEVPIEMSVKNLDSVGKKKESKPLTFEIPKEYSYDSEKYAKANAQKFADDGWIADTYFGSQGSYRYDNSGEEQKKIAVTTQYRYITE